MADIKTIKLGSKDTPYAELGCSLFSEDAIFVSLHTEEYIGGRLPFIHLVLSTTKEIAKLHDEVEFVIKNPAGYAINFKGYIYEMSYSQSNLDIKINGCPRDFVAKYHTNKRAGINQVINDLNPFIFDLDENIDPDKIPIQKTPYYQNHENDWSHLSDALFTYRKDIIWGYSLGELVIRGIGVNDWINDKAYEYKFYRKGASSKDENSEMVDCTPLSTHTISEPKRYRRELEVIDNYKFFKVCKLGSQLFYIYPETKNMFEIKLHNMRLTDFRQSIDVVCRFIPQLKLGSKGLFRSDETSDMKTFVSSRTIDINVHEVKVTLKLESIELAQDLNESKLEKDPDFFSKI